MQPIFATALVTLLICITTIRCHNVFPRLDPDDGIHLYHDSISNRDCIVGDIFCSDDCTTVQYCSSSGPIIVDTCNAGSLCDSITLTCVVGGLCTSPVDYFFVCNNLGLFPDPFNCTKYHICLPENIDIDSIVEECPSPHAYDPLSGLCSKTPQDRVCVESPIPACVTVGQVGPQVENPNIYYVCRRNGNVLYPSLYSCATDEIFEINKCVEVALSTSGIPNPSSTSSTSVGTASTTGSTASTTTTGGISTTTTAGQYPCVSEGQFPDPADCRGYYVCTEDLLAYHFRCSQEYHYESLRRVCEKPECSNQMIYHK